MGGAGKWGQDTADTLQFWIPGRIKRDRLAICKLVASENAKDAAIAYENFLASQNIMLNAEDEYTESQEDHLENCWEELPRSV
eukprot:9976206-Ditylum_brightwellii.AAC.1